MAPEVLRNDKQYTEKCDVYSFGIILYEVIFELVPYHDQNGSLTGFLNVCMKVLNGTRPEIPIITLSNTEQECVQLMKQCWDDVPDHRPSLDTIFTKLQNIINLS